MVEYGKEEDIYSSVISPELPLKPLRGRPKRTATEFLWSYESTELLIELWRNRTILYDVRHPDYHKRERKEKALDEIRDDLAESGVYVDISDITSKLTSLKSYFCQERRKIATSKTNSEITGGSSMPYESRWKFFRSLDFLGDNMTPRQTYPNSDSEIENTSLNDKSSLFYEPSNKRFRHSFESIDVSSIDESEIVPTSEYLQQPIVDTVVMPCSDRTEDDIFGELIVKKLKRIKDGPGKEGLKVKILLDVNNVLFKPCSSRAQSTGGTSTPVRNV